jgi:hypothetical protein
MKAEKLYTSARELHKGSTLRKEISTVPPALSLFNDLLMNQLISWSRILLRS